MNTRLTRGVDPQYDHVLGDESAEITLVEYGSYASPASARSCEEMASLREEFGDRLRYVFRHRPIPGRDIARKAAELAERAATPEQFWRIHVALMERADAVTEEDLRVIAGMLAPCETHEQAQAAAQRARARVDADLNSAHASGVVITPTFFINSRRYEGAWDKVSLSDALNASLGYRVRTAALDFARWAPSAGILLLLASVVAIILSNTSVGPALAAFWERQGGFLLEPATFQMSLSHWVNDALLTIFFLVVGLEIKREFTVGHLSTRLTAALPIAAAIGGLTAPAVVYSLLIPAGKWSHGWGVPMSTDTAFAVALIAMMGRRVPVELRIFLTAAAIVDDIGAIVVVAIFYSGELHFVYLGAAAIIVGVLAFLNRAHVYWLSPYLLVGAVLWVCVYLSGLHATLAGVLLAVFIPTLPPPNLKSLMRQANAIFLAESRHNQELLRNGPSAPALRALDTIHNRLESPAERMLRRAAPRSSYLILPLFALANAGVTFTANSLHGHTRLMLAIAVALIVGKPVGLVLASLLSVWLGWATKPAAYSWRQLAGAGALSGIGFTMSLFIAGEAFRVAEDFAAAKIAIFAASMLSALIGVAILSTAPAPRADD